MCRVVQGALYPAVRPKDILGYEIPLPSLDEQKVILAEIERQFTRLDAGVAALQRIQANLKRYRASILKAACEGRLVPTEAELARTEARSYEPADQLLARILTDRRQKWSGRGKYKEPVAPDTRYFQR
jgi:type I restriction enzyme S subunit